MQSNRRSQTVRNRLLREIDYFRGRVTDTAGATTPRQRAAHTLAKNCLNERRRKLLCWDSTWSFARWTDFHPTEGE